MENDEEVRYCKVCGQAMDKDSDEEGFYCSNFDCDNYEVIDGHKSSI